MNVEQIKQVIRKELPGIMLRDREMQKWVINLSKMHFPSKKTTESRFEAVIEDLKKQDKRWEENQQVIRKLLIGIENVNKRHDSTLGALGARWGMNTEKSFRNAMKGILEEHFSVKVLNITEDDPDGEVFAQPDQVELDLIIKNGLLIIVEIKSSMSRSDMDTFHRKVKFYTKKHQCQASKMMVISPMVEDRAKELARQYGIAVYSYTEEAEI